MLGFTLSSTTLPLGSTLYGSIWLVCQYPFKVKTAEPIGPKVCKSTYIAQGFRIKVEYKNAAWNKYRH